MSLALTRTIRACALEYAKVIWQAGIVEEEPAQTRIGTGVSKLALHPLSGVQGANR